MKKLRVNLGCGKDIKEGYLNIDLHSSDSRVKVANVLNLNFIKSNSIDEVYAKDILEHFNITDAKKALSEWSRILKFGGLLFLQTINVDKQIEAYINGIWTIEDLNHMVFAGVNWIDGIPKLEDYHKCAFNFVALKDVLEKNNIEIKSIDYDKIDARLKKNPRCHNLNMMIKGIKRK